MTLLPFLALFPALLALGAMAPGEPSVRSVVIRDELIIRIPVRPRPLPPAVRWAERAGPRCVATDSIRGAMLAPTGEVDFLLPGAARIRAQLSEDCPALDFYAGFYLTPQDDRICAKRDMIRSRMGGTCAIDGFRLLIPRRP